MLLPRNLGIAAFILSAPGMLLGLAFAGNIHLINPWVVTFGNVAFYTFLAYRVLRFLAYRRTQRIVGPP